MKNTKRFIGILSLSVAFIISMSILNVVTVYATGVSQANSATSYAGSGVHSVLHGDSTIMGYGNYAKLTLYLATTNDINQIALDGNGEIDMTKTPATRDDGKPMFIKFGKSIIDREGITLPTTTFANLATCKYDSLIDYKNGQDRYPVYNSSTKLTNSQLSNIGMPQWLTSDDETNEPKVVDYFKGGNDVDTACATLRKIIYKVAEMSDPSNVTDIDAVNNILHSAETKVPFIYKDSNRNLMKLAALDSLPEKGIAYWLVVYEPVIDYQQDPFRMFYPATGGNNFLMTATDSILQNAHSGTAGYPSIVKFAKGSPELTMTYNHCNVCDSTWFGYNWTHSALPLASLCPDGHSPTHYDGVKSESRYPFIITAAIKPLARDFTVQSSWLPNAKGFLFDKSTESIDNLIQSVTADENAILHYGGYSLFVNGPKMQPKSTPSPTPAPTPTATITPTPNPEKQSLDNVIHENELLKVISGTAGNISTVSIIKNSFDTTCNGTKQEWVPAEKDPDTGEIITPAHYISVPCGDPKDLAHAKNVVPKTLNVPTAWYWNDSMFGSLSKLAILRKSGAIENDGVNFIFNTTSPFVANDMRNVFSSLTSYKFITHRNSDSAILQTAAFMSNSTLNKNFQAFISPYLGSAYPSAFSNPTGDFGNGQSKTINITTSTTLPNSTTAISSGDFCSGGSSDSLNIPVKLSGSMLFGKTTIQDNTFKTSANITILPTVQETYKAAPVFKSDQTYWGIGNPDLAPSLYVRIPSQSISFFPTFKMTYDTNNSATSSSEVWMLSSGKRTFNSDDMVLFSLPEDKPSVQVDCPWSRDAEDRWEDYEKGGNNNHLVARTTPTAKSGSALKASTGNDGTVLKIDVIYHIQDPAFVDPSQRNAVQTSNEALAVSYDNMVKSVRDYLKNGGVSFYSNLLQANTPDTLHFLPSSDKVLDLSSKTSLKLGAPVTVDVGSVTQVALLDTDNTVQSDPTGTRTINVQGKNYLLNHTWNDTNAIKSQSVLDSLLVKNGGKTGFYTENYEGIILIHKTFFLTIHAETSYCQIHPSLSDSQTERNACAHRLPWIYDNKIILIEDGQYGVGLEVRLPNLTLHDGTTVTKGVLPSKIFPFDIKGSVYDTK